MSRTTSPQLLLALLAVALLAVACNRAQDPEPAPTPTPSPVESPEPSPSPTEEGFRAPLTGVQVDEDLSDRPLLGVKIDHAPAARPQYALEEADIVFEELVEGGATRFLALFHSHIPETIGPVRSARPTDVDLLTGYEAALAYSGARGEVQSQLRNAGLVLLEEGAPGFARDRSRRAPHNLMLNGVLALQTAADRGAEAIAEDVGWRFDPEAPEPDAEFDEATIAMSSSYRTGWTYDRSSAVYRRDQNGQPSEVAGEGQIGASNVIVLGMQIVDGGCCDTSGARYVDTVVTGEGPAIVLRDGGVYEASWRKSDGTSPLELLGPDGESFPLKPGPSWVMLAPHGNLPEIPAE